MLDRLLSPTRVARVLAAGALLAATCAPQSASAAQITFRFDAVVSQVAIAPDLVGQLQFEPAVGQTIAGQVTFTPVPFQESVQLGGKLEIQWESAVLSGNAQTLLILDNHISRMGIPFESFTISEGSNSFSGLGNSSWELVQFGLSLRNFDFVDLIPAGALVDNDALLNVLPDRILFMDFRRNGGFGALGITATVGPLYIVPEAFGLGTCLACVPMLAVCTRRRRRFLSFPESCTRAGKGVRNLIRKSGPKIFMTPFLPQRASTLSSKKRE